MKAIEIYPRDADTYSNRGAAHMATGKNDLAVADFSKAIEINPRNASAYYNRGAAYRAKGDINRAITDYTQAIEVNPHYANALLNRGIALAGQGRPRWSGRGLYYGDRDHTSKCGCLLPSGGSFVARGTTRRSHTDSKAIDETLIMPPLTTAAATLSRPWANLTALSRITKKAIEIGGQRHSSVSRICRGFISSARCSSLFRPATRAFSGYAPVASAALVRSDRPEPRGFLENAEFITCEGMDMKPSRFTEKHIIRDFAGAGSWREDRGCLP